ncbi:MAG: 3'(2'),5'-bisphosphate nucleotidase CysQ [Lysobacterales bacterium]
MNAAHRQALIEAASEVARRAAAAILDIYQRPELDITEKADESPLTAADMASHRLLCSGLSDLDAAIPVLSEESDPVSIADRRQWSRLWLVDPLDGTREFVSRNGQFCICIALIEDGEVTGGIVLRPVGGELYRAVRGGGAECLNADGSRTALRVTRPAEDPPRLVVSRSHRNAETEAYVARVGEVATVSAGSALKFCRVAAGQADLYPRLGFGGYEWDIAAGQILVEEAGGGMCMLNGERPRYNRNETLKAPSFLAFGEQRERWLGLLQD